MITAVRITLTLSDMPLMRISCNRYRNYTERESVKKAKSNSSQIQATLRSAIARLKRPHEVITQEDVDDAAPAMALKMASRLAIKTEERI